MDENVITAGLEGTGTGAGTRILKTIVYCGLTVGVLDALAATINSAMRGGSPIRVFQYVASGVLGPSSFEGGLATYLLGLFFHFTIAFGVSTVFVIASLFLPFLTRWPVYIVGPLYGIVVYFIMRDVISPLSHVERLNYSAVSVAIGLFIHMLCVGLPIALITRRFLSYTPMEPR